MYKFVYEQPEVSDNNPCNPEYGKLHFIKKELELKGATTDEEALQEIEKILSKEAIAASIFGYGFIPITISPKPVSLTKTKIIEVRRWSTSTQSLAMEI